MRTSITKYHSLVFKMAFHGVALSGFTKSRDYRIKLENTQWCLLGGSNLNMINCKSKLFWYKIGLYAWRSELFV